MATKLINQNISDRTPFWGVKVSPEFKYLQQIFNNKIPSVSISRIFYREIFKRDNEFFNENSIFVFFISILLFY